MQKVLMIGHSHLGALMHAQAQESDGIVSGARTEFVMLRDPQYALEAGPGDDPSAAASELRGVDRAALRRAIRSAGAGGTIFYLNGNGHNVFGIFRGASVPLDTKLANLRRSTLRTTREWLRFLAPLAPAPAAMLLPPPPLEEEDRIRAELAGRAGFESVQLEIEPSAARLSLWVAQCAALRTACEEFGIGVIELPRDLVNPRGFLPVEFLGGDPTHANAAYGARVLCHALEQLPRLARAPLPESPTDPNPYRNLPDHCFWRQAMSDVDAAAVDPVAEAGFRIQRRDKVATAGSCFAQHISRRLRESGYRFLVTEAPGADCDAQVATRRGFHDFSARYGNVYTARQLVQLFDRAYGYYRPLERVWERRGGGFCDPFRPRIEPEGYATAELVLADSQVHLAAVRQMFQRLDVFVFTLGLTECWVSTLDGAAYPVCPGVAGGTYDPARHVFVNFGVGDVVADLRAFLAKLHQVNRRARVLLTVSPVPLVATASSRHVLEATTWSKSVLRVAAGEIAATHEHVCYFPSYEIITGPHAGGRYFEADRRSVTAAGVDHVMRVFMSRFTDGTPAARPAPGTADPDTGAQRAHALAETLCDEEMLAR